MESMPPYEHSYYSAIDPNDNRGMGYQINYYEPCYATTPVVENNMPVRPIEEWKVSSQQPAESWRVWPSKPLPLEPPAPPPRRSFANRVAVGTGPWYPEPPSWPYLPTPMEQQQPYHVPENEHPVMQPLAYEPPPQQPTYLTDEEEEKNDPTKKKQIKNEADSKQKIEPGGRQITVQSINPEHRVWIKIDTTETGLTLAHKIHTIATFRTRKILSITTAAGRSIPLDHRPVFGSWMDMDSFDNGEQWKVEWGDLDKGFVDKIISRFIQVSGNRRK